MPHETEKLDEKKIRRSWWYTPFTDSNGFGFMEPWGDDDYVSEVDTPEELIEFLKDWDSSDDTLLMWTLISGLSSTTMKKIP